MAESRWPYRRSTALRLHWAALGWAGPPRGGLHARGRLGGRPPALSREDLAAAKALLRDPAITVEQVAKRLGVAPSTLYRHLPGGRSAVEPH